mmetsp:Transcript_28444/g.60323  ORF Transcript_28444/g.60323 Transcript_28444/m.60323 type:complete len:299 (+) Transcript_28444:927-1823(+)
MAELAQFSLEALELRRLIPERRGIVLKLVALHELVPLHLLVLALLHGQLLVLDIALLFELLLFLQHRFLLLRHKVRLLLVDRKARVLILLIDLLLQGRDFRLHGADLALQVVDVGFRDRCAAQRLIDVLQASNLALGLLPHPAQGLSTLADLVAKHLEHHLRVALSILLLRLAHLPEACGALDIHLLRLLELVPLLSQLLGQSCLLLLLLSEHGGHLQQHGKAFVLLGLDPQVLDLLRQLLALSIQLLHLPVQICGVHAPLPLLLHVLVCGLELRLELLVGLINLVDLLFPKELLGNL